MISPLSRLIAVMRPYGGFKSGNPRTVRLGAASSPPASRAAGARGRGGAPIALAGRGVEPAVPWTYSMSERFESGDGTRPRVAVADCENTYTVWVSGS